MSDNLEIPRLLFHEDKTTYPIELWDFWYNEAYAHLSCSYRCGKEADVWLDGYVYCLPCSLALLDNLLS